MNAETATAMNYSSSAMDAMNAGVNGPDDSCRGG
jgi:hypothetical protein